MQCKVYISIHSFFVSLYLDICASVSSIYRCIYLSHFYSYVFKTFAHSQNYTLNQRYPPSCHIWLMILHFNAYSTRVLSPTLPFHKTYISFVVPANYWNTLISRKMTFLPENLNDKSKLCFHLTSVPTHFQSVARKWRGRA